MLNQFARLGALSGAVAIVLSAVLPAVAAPTVFRDTDNNVMGLQLQTRVSLIYNGMMRGRDYQANPCGLITLRNETVRTEYSLFFTENCTSLFLVKPLFFRSGY